MESPNLEKKNPQISVKGFYARLLLVNLTGRDSMRIASGKDEILRKLRLMHFTQFPTLRESLEGPLVTSQRSASVLF